MRLSDFYRWIYEFTYLWSLSLGALSAPSLCPMFVVFLRSGELNSSDFACEASVLLLRLLGSGLAEFSSSFLSRSFGDAGVFLAGRLLGFSCWVKHQHEPPFLFYSILQFLIEYKEATSNHVAWWTCGWSGTVRDTWVEATIGPGMMPLLILLPLLAWPSPPPPFCPEPLPTVCDAMFRFASVAGGDEVEELSWDMEPVSDNL